MQTKLEVINYLLGVLGSSPVSSLEDTLHPDVATCLNRWEEANLAIQKKGWWFNQEYKVELTPDTDGKIYVPQNTLEVAVTSMNALIKRGTKLYNTVTQSYYFTAPVTANLILKLDYSLLDDSVIDVIRFRAAIMIAELDLEDSTKAQLLMKFFIESLTDLKKINLRTQRRNMLNTPATRRGRRGTRSFNPLFPGG